MHSALSFLCAALFLGAASLASAQDKSKPRGNIGVNGPKAGTAAPDFTLMTVEGKSVQASSLWKDKPTVIMTASHTCPVFRGKVTGFQAVAKEYAEQVNFLVVYTIEAHPKGDPSPYSGKEWVTPKNEQDGILFRQPTEQSERTKRARECVEREKMTVPVVVDTLENTVWKAYGCAPNCAYVIGTDGKIADAQPWMELNHLRQTLARLTAK